MQRFASVVIVTAFVLGLAGTVTAGPITTKLYSDDVDDGADTKVDRDSGPAGDGSWLAVYGNNQDNRAKIWLRFDLGSLPLGRTVTGARLSVFGVDASHLHGTSGKGFYDGDTNVRVYGLNNGDTGDGQGMRRVELGNRNCSS